MNPYVDKWGAAFGAFIMGATPYYGLGLSTLLSHSNGEHPVFYVNPPCSRNHVQLGCSKRVETPARDPMRSLARAGNRWPIASCSGPRMRKDRKP